MSLIRLKRQRRAEEKNVRGLELIELGVSFKEVLEELDFTLFLFFKNFNKY